MCGHLFQSVYINPHSKEMMDIWYSDKWLGWVDVPIVTVHQSRHSDTGASFYICLMWQLHSAV